MSEHSINEKRNQNGKKTFVAGILTYGSLQPILFAGAERVDRRLREQAKERDPKARNRRQQEVIYQWTMSDNSFWMRFYTSIDTNGLVTRAQRTGRAKLRVSVRDAKSKQVVEFVSGTVELAKDQTGWEPLVREMLDRAFLFVSRNRPICPLCKKQMEIRTGKRGDFWGCSQFPECRGTRNIPAGYRTPDNAADEAATDTANVFDFNRSQAKANGAQKTAAAA